MKPNPGILTAMLLFLGFLFPGCIAIDTLPQLEITVLDDSGKAVPGAYVALFDSNDDWNQRSIPVLVWRKTDDVGKVLFIDLETKGYFIYARFENRDNSLSEIATAAPLELNRKHQIIVHIR